MAAGIKTIILRFAGDAKGVATAAKQAESSVGKFESAVGKASAAIAGAAVAAGAGLLKIGSDFDAAFDSIAVGTGAVGTKLEGLQEDFKAAFAETPGDMQPVADALTALNTLTGATGETLQDLTVQVSEASRMLGEDAAGNAQAFGQAMAQWQLPAEQGAGMLDVLFKATQDYGVSLGGIIGHLNTYGSVLQNVGFSMDESAALFAGLEAGGISVSRVMPGLNKAFRDWASEGKNVQHELAGAVDQIKNASTSTEALAIATDVFGAQGAQRLTTAIRNGTLELDGLSTALDGAEGLIAGTAEETDSWGEKLGKLKNQGLVAVEPLASALFDKLSSGVDILKSVVEWGQRNTGVVKGLGIALGVVAGTILAVNAGLKVYHGVQIAIRAATIAWTAVQWLLNVALSANPIGIIIVAVAALVAGIILLWKNSETFRNIVTGAFNAVWSAIKFVWDWVKDNWPLLLAILTGPIGLAVKFIIDHWDAIKAGFQAVRDFLGAAVNWVKERFKAGFQAVRDTVERVGEFILGIPGRIRDVFRKVTDFISAPFRAGFDAVKRFWNNTIGGKGFDIPSWVPGVGGQSFRFPRFHSGGVVPGPPGQEVLAILRAGERVQTREAAVTDAGGEFTGTLVLDSGQFLGVVHGEIQRRDRMLRRRVLAGVGGAR